MPILMVYTNLAKSSIPETFSSVLTHVLADTLSKPVAYCTVHIMPDQMLTIGDSSEPCAHASVFSIGKLGIEENKKHTHAIMSELEKLGIDAKRMFIRFIDAKAEDVGWDHSTFHGKM